MTPSLYLHPGQLYAAHAPFTVTTILGSCVAVSLWDPVLRAGGLNHFLLPYWAGDGHASPRFGNVAVARLLEATLALGADRERLQAKLFGGGCVIEALRGPGEHLGEKNAAAARRVLGRAGIAVVAEDLGGGRGRRLVFHGTDGSAWVKRL